jgi:hypothetical protein
MGGLPALNWYVNYKEDSLYGGWLYRGNTVLIYFPLSQLEKESFSRNKFMWIVFILWTKLLYALK